MSRSVLFNSAVLVRPGAATKIDASQFTNVALSGLGVVALIGAANGGEPQTVQTFYDSKAVANFYRSGDLVEAAGILADPGNDPRIPAGASQIVCYKVNDSTRSTLVHDTAFTFTSIDYGLHANNIRLEISTSGADARTLVITALDVHGNLLTETSPEFGGAGYGKFSIQYTGVDGSCTMTITATTLACDTSATPADDVAITFADYNSLQDIVWYIDGLAVYDCTSLITNASSFDPTNLDALVAQDIKTSVYTTMAHNFDLSDWVNVNSQLISCALTKGQTGPRIVLAEVAMAGGTLGDSANADWVTGLIALESVHINQVVPLASADGVVPDTYTIDSINAAAESHCKTMSATAGKDERQGWLSLSDTKTNLISAANVLNSEHVQLTGQKVTRNSAVTGDQTVFDEWSLAATLAGMRAGAPLGEPLTWKYIKGSALSNDASWGDNNNDDVTDLILNGVMTVATIPGKGFRIEKGITTYTKSDNDAFTEETIVQGWKYIAYEWRTQLEDQFTGRPGTVETVRQVEPVSVSVLDKLRREGAITDSIIDGAIVPGYRDIAVALSGDTLEVGGTISPTPGINFTLNTVVLVPASISL